MSWKPIETAPKDGTWIVVKYGDNHPFTVRWCTPFLADPDISDWRDEHGKVRRVSVWKSIE